MQTIQCKVVPASPGLFKELEDRGLIRRLAHTAKASAQSGKGFAQCIYKSRGAHGSHKLICVSPRSHRISLNSHPDNEEFLLINGSGRLLKPVHMLVSLLKHDALDRLLRAKRVSDKDFVCIRCAYNDPRTSFFTMLKGTVHCEFECPGRGSHPVFFVTEPSDLPMRRLRAPGYRFIV